MASFSEDDLSCSVCQEIFKDPVVLSCSHSFCKACLQKFWRISNTRMCPLCKRDSRDDPPCNLVLKNLCESFVKERKLSLSSESEEICNLHPKKLELFCLEDKQPVCLACVTSQKHDNHKFRPISEVTPAYKEELNKALTSIREKLKHNENIKGEFEKTIQNIKAQATHTEREIKDQFEKLHQFLRDEEEATITALREEEEQKKQTMKEKLEEMNTHISALSHTIRDTEEMLKDNDVCFLKKFPGSMERVQISQPGPQMPSGALIHVPRYLGNLSFRVWEKMRDIVSYSYLHSSDHNELEALSDICPAEEQIIKVELEKPPMGGLGFSITGGKRGIFVKAITPKSTADAAGTLQVGDRLLKVNDDVMVGMPHSKAVTTIRKATGLVQLIISRSPEQMPI